MPKLNTEYAIYSGDELLVVGTLDECAAHQNISRSTVHFLASNANKKRVASRRGIGGKGSSRGKVAYKLTDDEDLELEDWED